ncbi:hypothetical protein BO79DRAFT_209884 [Aspergillus costaricaensis CBS 115574]|uniref:Uncharacterized protein n=1 Tax=Aspergillus costaricaensis CBS 115574 TaxID=1448317 RepID=A0ACD1IA13_9EURO|nr:hypothetical protein BO79DRAFT_209884 [Aspergillus costaricaensis CBS 115574]RAK87072.1 hypothetical protein BO79DRAFT_209884 [Aspergillus costaricaensis CBS 115574]
MPSHSCINYAGQSGLTALFDHQSSSRHEACLQIQSLLCYLHAYALTMLFFAFEFSQYTLFASYI